ncbi:MAG: polar amino acid transport system substrate-binding protein, partial [Solirubrobacterales bacterium]|nr:polar amino acid transport system substrate-binding protein [Solirubrobacterales bacterium]
MKKLLATLVLALALGLLAVGCGSSGDDSSSNTSASAGACEPGNLPTETAGVLTVATDKPAFPPYFEDDDPTNGEGFESAVAYAIAKQLGYPPAKVKWTVEPFNSSYAPGPKDFDFDVNQISISPVREKAVDFSAPYYTANQAVLALKDSDAAKATTIEDLKDVQFGVQLGTTSLSATEEVIDPSSKPEVFNNSTD